MPTIHRRPRPGERVQLPHSRAMGYVGEGPHHTIILGTARGAKGHGVVGASHKWDGKKWVSIQQK